jgi:hypothetical protein
MTLLLIEKTPDGTVQFVSREEGGDVRRDLPENVPDGALTALELAFAKAARPEIADKVKASPKAPQKAAARDVVGTV